MRAVVFDQPGDAAVLRLGTVAAPDLAPGQVRIRVAATAVNRADILQRRGLYPPPPGTTDILGLECAGVVVDVAGDVERWEVGDRVMALLPGGGYAEEVVVHEGSVLRIPDALGFTEAAAIPETFLTVFLNVFRLGGLREGGVLLVHGGGSGIGTAAIRLARAAGATVLVTAGSDRKCEACRQLGASAAVNYRRADFVEAVMRVTEGRGADVVLDSIGGPYLMKNLQSLAPNGRLMLIGLMGGARGSVDLRPLLVRHLSVAGSTLRGRPLADKASIVAGFEARFGELLRRGDLRPVVDRVLPLAEAAEAHRVVEASEHFGKVVLAVG